MSSSELRPYTSMVALESQINNIKGGNMKELTVYKGFLYEQIGDVGSPQANQAIAAQNQVDTTALNQIDAEMARARASLDALAAKRQQISVRINNRLLPGQASPQVVQPVLAAGATVTPSSQYTPPGNTYQQPLHECDDPLIKSKGKMYKVVRKQDK